MLEYGKKIPIGRRAAVRRVEGSSVVRMRAGTGVVRQADSNVDEADGDIAEVAAASVGIFERKGGETQ